MFNQFHTRPGLNGRAVKQLEPTLLPDVLAMLLDVSPLLKSDWQEVAERPNIRDVLVAVFLAWLSMGSLRVLADAHWCPPR
eukprot:2217900-Amphidinium_carterae.1